MRHIKGLGVIAATAWVVFACAAVDAGAHEFEVSKTGKMSAKGTAVQVFATEDGTIECAEATAGGEAGSLKTVTVELQLTLKTCLVFGFLPTMFLPVPFILEFHADGTLIMIKGMLIADSLFVIGGGCEVTFPEQGPATKATYKNVGERVEFIVEVTGLEYTAKNCPINGTFKNGTYKGKFLDELVGGKFSWK